MLSGFPLLRELDCEHNYRVTGNIRRLRVLKDTLEKVNISVCEGVEGNFMDLADFTNLKDLFLPVTAVTGDIRDIGESDFPSLEELDLHHNKGITDNGLAALVGIKTLKLLDVTGTSCGAAGRQALKQKLPECTIRISN